MSNAFENRTAAITGAGAGIGFAIARQLALEGASVVLNDIDEDRLKVAVDKIKAEGGDVVAYHGDAGTVEVVRGLIDHACETFGDLDLVIANAGLTIFGDVFACQPEDFRRVLDVNLLGTFFLVQSASRQMKKQGRGGKILLMSSNIGVRPYPELAPYGMTKAALNMLARTLALELAPQKITINALAPGATITERTLHDDANYKRTWEALIPDGQVAKPEEIARAALFLLSPDADHITGQTLVIDGGWSELGRYPGASTLSALLNSNSVQS